MKLTMEKFFLIELIYLNLNLKREQLKVFTQLFNIQQKYLVLQIHLPLHRGFRRRRSLCRTCAAQDRLRPLEQIMMAATTDLLPSCTSPGGQRLGQREQLPLRQTFCEITLSYCTLPYPYKKTVNQLNFELGLMMSRYRSQCENGWMKRKTCGNPRKGEQKRIRKQ